MTKEALGVGGTNPAKGFGNGGQQVRVVPGLGLAQVGFDFRPHHFDGIEIGTVGGQQQQLCSFGFDELLRFGVAVGREVVADHEVAHAQGGAEHLPDLFAKYVGVGGPFDHQATGHPVEPDRAEHGDGVPMAARGVIVQPLAAANPATSKRIFTGRLSGYALFESQSVDRFEQGGFSRWPEPKDDSDGG